eukprot:1190541-Rhodomonas_salina.1
MGPEIPPVVMNLTVEYDLPARKPYHGGYRHKVTGIVYHHAASWTISTVLGPNQPSCPSLLSQLSYVHIPHPPSYTISTAVD